MTEAKMLPKFKADGTVQNLKLTKFDDHFKLEWNPPPPSSWHGIPLAYKISVQDGKGRLKNFHINLDIEEVEAAVMRNKNYILKIYAHNLNSMDFRNLTFSVQTQFYPDFSSGSPESRTYQEFTEESIPDYIPYVFTGLLIVLLLLTSALFVFYKTSQYLRNTVRELWYASGIPSFDPRAIEPLQEKLGKGFFAETYAGLLREEKKQKFRTVQITTPVAVKKLNREREDFERNLKTFLLEAHHLWQLNKAKTHHFCKYVIQCHGVVLGKPEYMLIMERASDNLQDYLIDKQNQLTVQELLRLATDTAKAGCFIHSQNLVHRDVKANNLLVLCQPGAPRSFLRVVMGDFGLGRYKFEGEYVGSGQMLMFHPYYAAPECFINKFTQESDVFAFGLTLWEIFTYGLFVWPFSYLGTDQMREIRQDQYSQVDNGSVGGEELGELLPQQPLHCPRQIYQLILACLKLRRETRKPFSRILSTLEEDIQIPKNSTGQKYVFDQTDFIGPHLGRKLRRPPTLTKNMVVAYTKKDMEEDYDPYGQELDSESEEEKTEVDEDSFDEGDGYTDVKVASRLSLV